MCLCWCCNQCLRLGSTHYAYSWWMKHALSTVYIFSNWSTRRLVLPLRISRKVLYLSRPWRTFSLWILSIAVSFDSSRDWAKSCFRAWILNTNEIQSFNIIHRLKHYMLKFCLESKFSRVATLVFKTKTKSNGVRIMPPNDPNAIKKLKKAGTWSANIF